MSLREISVVIRAVNRASNEFSRIGTDAEAMAARIKSAGSVIAGLGATSQAVAFLGRQFAFLTSEQTRWLSNISGVITALGVFLRTSWGVAIAQKIYTIATAIAAKVTWIFNAALAMKVALLTLGVGLVVATAAYMAWLASTTRDATSAMRDYNAELERMSSFSSEHGGSLGLIQIESLRRRGVEI